MPKSKKASKLKRLQAKPSKPVHPNSRKAQQLTRKQIHKDKVVSRKKDLSLKLKTKIDKFAWFHEKLYESSKDRLSPAELHDLIEEYFHRFDDETEHVQSIEQIRGNVNQFKGRLDAIKMTLEKDTRDYTTCGLEVPDLLNPASFKVFVEWDGSSVAYLPKIAAKAYSKAMLQSMASKS